MDKPSDKIYENLPILTLAGGDQKSCEKILEKIVSGLKSKSVKTLAVFYRKDAAVQTDRVITCLNSSYDAVFIDFGVETCVGVAEGNGHDRIEHMLSPFYSRYDLIIVCSTETVCLAEFLIFEGFVQQEKVFFRLNTKVDIARLISCLHDWLCKKLVRIPIWGCVLIGGKSSRMGRPKHLIEGTDGVTWAEKIVHTLSEHTEKVILSGKGVIPESLDHLERIADIPEAQGPLAGILAAMRLNPHVSFIVAACDMPGIQRNSLTWLLNRRRPGIWGTVPLHPQTQRYEPLLAYYDFRSRILFEQLLQTGSLRPNHVCRSDKIETPTVPSIHADCWINCNTPEDLAAIQDCLAENRRTNR